MKSRLPITPETALLYVLARSSARRNHVPEVDVDDHAIEFIADVIQKNAKPEVSATPSSLNFWRKAAGNWMKNALRDDRRRRRETAWPETEDADGQAVVFDPQDSHPGPDVEAFRAELRNLLAYALQELSAQPKEFLLRHVIEGETYAAIAVETGKTADAVRKIVTRALAHLRTYLERHGLDATEAEDYLAIMSPLPRKGGLSDHIFALKTDFLKKVCQKRKITRPVLATSGVIYSEALLHTICIQAPSQQRGNHVYRSLEDHHTFLFLSVVRNEFPTGAGRTLHPIGKCQLASRYKRLRWFCHQTRSDDLGLLWRFGE